MICKDVIKAQVIILHSPMNINNKYSSVQINFFSLFFKPHVKLLDLQHEIPIQLLKCSFSVTQFYGSRCTLAHPSTQ